MEPVSGEATDSLERELRLIEAQCGAGLLNAFGADREEHDLMREIGRISQLQTQIFRRCVEQVAQSSEELGSMGVQEDNSDDLTKSSAKREQCISQVNGYLQKLGMHVAAVNDKVKERAEQRREQLAARPATLPSPSPTPSRSPSLASADP
eukprot:TRINITY_DN15425_c0_g1_i1.p1 TRINITY_DN15425_c0_g1~~TRINITY_DN15425_c0_g1_i1.p1  ORF type:complete len:151 (+),score=24.25 TRINITY_DN15425_c0_g1_i1:41-493(+)